MKIVKTYEGFILEACSKEEEIFLEYLIKLLEKFSETIKDVH